MNEKNEDLISKKRNLTQYINDVKNTEMKGIYPEYSNYRKKILSFWEKALKENSINQNDSVRIALKQIYKKNLP